MKSARIIFEQHTSKIKQAATATEKAQAKTAWDDVYSQLPESYKTEIRAMLKAQANDLLQSQANLDSQITALGLPSFEVFLEQNAVAY
jgi:hypothetical protein